MSIFLGESVASNRVRQQGSASAATVRMSGARGGRRENVTGRPRPDLVGPSQPGQGSSQPGLWQGSVDTEGMEGLAMFTDGT